MMRVWILIYWELVVVGFCEGHALVLYVYLTDMDEDHSAVLTVRVDLPHSKSLRGMLT